jgi:predicted short-subunit dehydrogenase-like oxidoreductase (DUF2520 family)
MTTPDTAPSRAPRPRLGPIGIIGAGRVGAVLGAALVAAGKHVAAVSAVSDASRARAAAMLPGVPVLPPDRVAAEADLLLLAVPDDVLAGLVAGLADVGGHRGALAPGALVAHVSGRHGLAVLAPAVARGARALAAHPAMTFTGTSADLARLPGTTFAVTAAAEAAELGRSLVELLGGVPVAVPEAARPLYHAALAHGANHLTTLVGSAAGLLRAAGLGDPAGVLRPLLAAALDNALRAGDAALTGPVARGDADTVAAHVEAIGAAAPAELGMYTALAQATAGRAVGASRLSAGRAAAVLDALDPNARSRRRAQP